MDKAIQHYFQEHASGWDERMPPNYGAILQSFALPFAAEFQAASRILEIGTGTGALIPVLRGLAQDSSLISADFAHAMLVQAHKRSSDARLLQADVHELPFASVGFDVVICHNSFPHFSDKTRALHEIQRVLRPGGKLMILHNNSREFVNAIHTRVGAPLQYDLLPEKDVMRQLLERTGWAAVTVDDAPTHYVATGQREQ